MAENAAAGTMANVEQMSQQVRDLTLAAASLSANLALFGIEQLRNSTEIATNPNKGLENVKASINRVAEAVKGDLNEQDKKTAENLGKFISDWTGKVLDLLVVPAMDVRKAGGAFFDSIGHVIGAATSIVPHSHDDKKDEKKEEQRPAGGQ